MLYLAANARDGIAEVQYGNDKFEVTLDGLDDGDVLAIKSVKGVNTQSDRKNQVILGEGNTIIQFSNNGNHIVAVTLEADGQEIVDPSQTIYSLKENDELGITTPEASGNAGEYYTYGAYLKYKNGDYEESDIEDRTMQRRLVVPGKGYVDITFTLHAEVVE